tara:strand:+ start:114 stop:1649 length:1536 start_codon:yes stop_codon:yes gene_type:complete
MADKFANVEHAHTVLRSTLAKCHIARVFDVIHNLVQFRHYQQPLNRIGSIPRNLNIRPDSTFLPFPWELSILAKEAAIHSTYFPQIDFGDWPTLATCVNAVKFLSHKLHPDYEDPDKGIWRQLQRIAHLQFPWQQAVSTNDLGRNHALFSQDGLRQLTENHFEADIDKLVFNAFGVASLFMNNATVDVPIKNVDAIFDKPTIEKIYSRVSIPIEIYRSELRKKYALDENYEYSYNLIYSKPLIRLPYLRSMVSCPFPYLYMKRINDGIFYDLVSEEGFSDAMGTAFERFIGGLLEEELNGFDLYTEARFGPPKARKHSIDFLARQEAVSLFVECKTKRPTWAAKFDIVDHRQYDSDLEKIAREIAKMYVNLNHYLSGDYEHVQPKQGEMVYPLFVTIEDWFLVQIGRGTRLRLVIDEYLTEREIDSGIVDRYPFEIMDIKTFEMLLSAIDKVGVGRVLGDRQSSPHKNDFLSAYLQNRAEKLGCKERNWEIDWDQWIDRYRAQIPNPALPE